MLKKLLKYDLKSMLKYWWLVSIISLTLSCAGAFCLRLLISGRELPGVISFFSVISLIFAILGVIIFTIFAVIKIYIRFFKNFFTDEGYLTFTLPVTRIQLLNSKIISGLIINCITGLVCIIDLAIILGAGLYEYIFTAEVAEVFKIFFKELWKELGFYTVIYAIELIMISIISSITSIIFTFICITLASVITRKAKGLIAVVLYYVINSAVSTIIQILSFLATPFLGWLANVPETQLKPMFILCLATFILIASCICSILYTLEYRMLDKRLNLA